MARRAAAVFGLAFVFAVASCGDEPTNDDELARLQGRIHELEQELGEYRRQDLAQTTTSTPPTTAEGPALGGDVVLFLGGLGHHQRQVEQLALTAATLNGAWDDRIASYAETLTGFRQVQSATESIATDLAAMPVPAEFSSHYAGIMASGESLSAASAGLVAGLQAPDDGTLRQEAMATFSDAVDNFRSDVGRILRTVDLGDLGSPVTTATTRATTTTSAATTSSTSTTTTTTTTTTAAPACHPSYEGRCVPAGVSDVDCAGGSGNGPYYTGRVRVVGPDVYGLDRDGDGIGCE